MSSLAPLQLLQTVLGRQAIFTIFPQLQTPSAFTNRIIKTKSLIQTILYHPSTHYFSVKNPRFRKKCTKWTPQCLTSLVRDFTGVCPGSYPSKYFPQLWFTSDTSCSFLEEGDLHFSASDPYQIKRGLCSAETEALLLDQENCVQPLLSQRDDIVNSLNTLIWSTCTWQTWQAWTKATTITTKPSTEPFGIFR